MATDNASKTPHLRSPSWITTLFFVSGLWLMLSPYVLGYSWHPSVWWNALVIGAGLLVLAVVRYSNPQRFDRLRWTALVLGAWMVASPFVADFYHLATPTWNAVIVGAVVILGATSSVAVPARKGA